MLHLAEFISALDIVPRPAASIYSSAPHPADSHQFKNEFISSGEFEVITSKEGKQQFCYPLPFSSQMCWYPGSPDLFSVFLRPLRVSDF